MRGFFRRRRHCHDLELRLNACQLFIEQGADVLCQGGRFQVPACPIVRFSRAHRPVKYVKICLAVSTAHSWGGGHTSFLGACYPGYTSGPRIPSFRLLLQSILSLVISFNSAAKRGNLRCRGPPPGRPEHLHKWSQGYDLHLSQ
jgi:hypothetical protein